MSYSCNLLGNRRPKSCCCNKILRSPEGQLLPCIPQKQPEATKLSLRNSELLLMQQNTKKPRRATSALHLQEATQIARPSPRNPPMQRLTRSHAPLCALRRERSPSPRLLHLHGLLFACENVLRRRGRREISVTSNSPHSLPSRTESEANTKRLRGDRRGRRTAKTCLHIPGRDAER